MKKINFQDNVTKANAETMNLFQSNIEEGINSVVESGSNSNGSWIKYSDGTMICYGIKLLSGTSIESSAGGLFFSNPTVNIEYPINFIGLPTLNINTQSGTKAVWIGSFQHTNIKISTIFLLSMITRPNIDITLNWTAIGRWK